jgi:hypothetical protein
VKKKRGKTFSSPEGDEDCITAMSVMEKLTYGFRR